MIIASGKNLLACAFISAICSILGCNQFSFLIPPYFYLSGKKNFKSEEIWQISSITEYYCSHALRTFLVAAVSWKKKEVSVNKDILDLAEKMRCRTKGFSSEDNLDSLLEKLDRKSMEKELVRGRKEYKAPVYFPCAVLGEE